MNGPFQRLRRVESGRNAKAIRVGGNPSAVALSSVQIHHFALCRSLSGAGRLASNATLAVSVKTAAARRGPAFICPSFSRGSAGWQ